MEAGQKFKAYAETFANKVKGADWDEDMVAAFKDFGEVLEGVHDTHIAKRVGLADDPAPPAHVESATLTDPGTAGHEAVRRGDVPDAIPGVTMFVRADGDDTQDGLSVADAKASLQSALDDAPIHGDNGSYLTIDVAPGTVLGGLSLANTSVGTVYLTGAGSGQTTIDADGDSFALRCDSSRCVVADLTLQGGSTAPFACISNSQLTFARDVVARHGGLNGGRIFGSSEFRLGDGCVVDQTGVSAGGDGTLNVADSVVTIDGTVRGHSGHSLVKLYANGTVFAAGSFEGEGTSSTDWGFEVTENSHIKFPGGATASDMDVLFHSRFDAIPKILGSPTLTNVNARWKFSDMGGALDGDRGVLYKQLPVWSTSPDPPELGSGRMQGLHGFNTSTGFPETWSRQEDAWLTSGRKKILDETYTFAGNEVLQGPIPGITDGELAAYNVVPTPIPGSNRHRYRGQTFHNPNASSGSRYRWWVQERENQGGGDCRIIVYKTL